MEFLDCIYEVPGLDFSNRLLGSPLSHVKGSADPSLVGNSNELNAAYAADGYARVKGVPGCRESLSKDNRDRDKLISLLHGSGDHTRSW